MKKNEFKNGTITGEKNILNKKKTVYVQRKVIEVKRLTTTGWWYNYPSEK